MCACMYVWLQAMADVISCLCVCMYVCMRACMYGCRLWPMCFRVYVCALLLMCVCVCVVMCGG
jgi:hypothetical protein